MDELKDIYFEEVNPKNELKGFTKSFSRKGKEKKQDNPQIKELLKYKREEKLIYGEKVCEKAFKNNTIEKVFLSSNCKEITKKKIEHYGKISNVDIITMEIDNNELSAKLIKPFLVNVISALKITGEVKK